MINRFFTEEIMAGCGNHWCFIEKPKGMGTNRACYCLDSLGKENAAVVRRKLRAFDFYKCRVVELEKHKDKFPEPYFKMICNILENGKIDHSGKC